MIKKLTISLLLLVIASVVGFLYVNQQALFVEKRTTEQLTSLISPTFDVIYPEGVEEHSSSDSLLPVAVLVHGCGGRKEADFERAQKMASQGFIAVTFASQAPRGLSVQQVCNGEALLGFERVADLQLALDYAKQLPLANKEQIVVLGYSHGAFTLFEAMARQGEQLAAISDHKQTNLEGVAAAIAYYPYCGAAAFYKYIGGQYQIPTLVFTAGRDQITAPLPCGEFVAKRQALGEPMSIMHFSGVSHGFDIEEEWVKHYDAAVADQAFDQQIDFINKHLNR